MIIIDQNKVEVTEDKLWLGGVHRKMILDSLSLETIEELSCTGLVILQTGGFHEEIEAMKLKDKLNTYLSDYDFKTADEKYKMVNLTFI